MIRPSEILPILVPVALGLLLLCRPSPAAAVLNCTANPELLCADLPRPGIIGDSGSNGSAVYCGAFGGYVGKEDVYTFSLVSQTEIQLLLTMTGGQDADVFIVADCDPAICFAASFNTGTTPDAIFTCLGPGVYRVVVDARTTVNVPYEIRLSSCNNCLPVPALPSSWSRVKARRE
ncbi:MAG: hypothetical protein SGI90_03735 [Candidatus Eisenbacteria bacterium]|nr:hypothetical protein [Candidatus Eisenbacteria bacterium]